MRLSLGLSPCPNDTFIFDAIIHQKIDTEGLEFDVFFADVEKLNRCAFQAELDITKLSYHAFMYCYKDYVLLDSGSALGRGCGPILISSENISLTPESKIAIPGKYTTANMLLDIMFPLYINKVEMLFSDIEDNIINRKIDAGVIIHENRFTYQQKGLNKIVDLGELWENDTGLPIPLGGIVVKRVLSLEIQKKIERVIRKSVQYALANPNSSNGYVRSHAQEISQEVVDSHIRLYVNNYSVSLQDDGRKAVEYLFKRVGLNTNQIFLTTLFFLNIVI